MSASIDHLKPFVLEPYLSDPQAIDTQSFSQALSLEILMPGGRPRKDFTKEEVHEGNGQPNVATTPGELC